MQSISEKKLPTQELGLGLMLIRPWLLENKSQTSVAKGILDRGQVLDIPFIFSSVRLTSDAARGAQESQTYVLGCW